MTPGSVVEARYDGGAWTNIPVVGEDYSGTIPGVAEGQGTVEVRANGEYLDPIPNVAVGDNWLIMGQSNAAGRLLNSQSYSHGSLIPGMLQNDLNWYELADPTDDNTNQVYEPTRDIIQGGSIWPLLATHIMADQGVPVGFITASKGGTRIIQHLPDDDHLDTTTIYGVANTMAALAGGIKAVLWWQGEGDVQQGTSEADYNSRLDTLANAIAVDMGVPTVVSNQFILPNDHTAVNTAIATAISDNANVLQGPDISDITPSAAQHITTDAEGATVAGRWWTALEALFYP